MATWKTNIKNFSISFTPLCDFCHTSFEINSISSIWCSPLANTDLPNEIVCLYMTLLCSTFYLIWRAYYFSIFLNHVIAYIKLILYDIIFINVATWAGVRLDERTPFKKYRINLPFVLMNFPKLCLSSMVMNNVCNVRCTFLSFCKRGRTNSSLFNFLTRQFTQKVSQIK